MSTGERRDLADARIEAEAFRTCFAGCYEAWEIAGSVRRQRRTVGDIEHVVIAKVENRETGKGLFAAETEPRNLMLDRLDELVGAGAIGKHVYADGKNRWGSWFRGVDFRGYRHEVFLATPENWGAILAIRTGPAEYSQALVSRLLATGNLRQQDGYVRYTTGQNAGKIVPTRTEEIYFKLCNVPFCPPEKRDDVARQIARAQSA